MDLMGTLCANIAQIVEPDEDVVAFIVVLLKKDGNLLVQSKAAIPQVADILDGAHDAIAQTVDEAFEGKFLL